MEKSDLGKEFQQFISEETDVPQELTKKIFDDVNKDLHPSAVSVFGKISALQFGVGVLTLLICPQFGVSLTSSHGLMAYLMKYGDTICMTGCGAFFTSVSFLVAGLVLRPEEINTLRQNQVLQISALALGSLGLLICLGAQVVAILGFVWLVGAIVGAKSGLEIGWMLHRRKIMGAST